VVSALPPLRANQGAVPSAPQGGVVSAFARSVAAHVKALAEPNAAVWDPADAKVRGWGALLLGADRQVFLCAAPGPLAALPWCQVKP
jgi:hypothetical protein